MSEQTEGRRPEGSQNQEIGHTPNVKPETRPGKSGRQEDHRTNMGRSRSSAAGCGDETRPGAGSEENRSPATEGPEISLETIHSIALDLELPACTVCLCAYDNAFKTPKLLSCRHTFCLECLARINVISPKLDVLSCPVCRKPTALPHGQDLPGLQDNQDILRQLPPESQTALPVRFKRCKGRLLLKQPPLGATVRSYLTASATEDQRGRTMPCDHVTYMEQEAVHTTVAVDVGKPPSRVKGAMLRFLLDLFCAGEVCPILHCATMVILLVLLAILGVMMLFCSGEFLPLHWCYYGELSFILTIAVAGSFVLATSRLPSVIVAFFQCVGDMPA